MYGHVPKHCTRYWGTDGIGLSVICAAAALNLLREQSRSMQ